MLIAENDGLRVLQQDIEEEVRIQDAVNLALQDEIRELRVLLAQDAQQPLQQLLEPEPELAPEPMDTMDPEPEQELIRNTGCSSQPSTSGRIGVDENTSPPEATGA
ncbi:uncharacterized protein LOC123209646 [Mangifera indica]|uniref:uncharacterized protein LOC123209646 n=1 Tax=Mangifera indica TaxID=29780 RepID=UPI001CFB9B52|nr:uncharacterized protein LOC123209646 [Mangifera indica]